MAKPITIEMPVRNATRPGRIDDGHFTPGMSSGPGVDRVAAVGEAHRQPDWVKAFLVLLTHGMGINECAVELNQTVERLLSLYNSTAFKALLQERMARHGQVNPQAIQGAASDAFMLCHGIILSPAAPTAQRLKAAQLVMDRAWGRVPERVILPDKELPSDPADLSNALTARIIDAIKADPALRETVKAHITDGN